jgi:hypothetical protein
MNTLKKEMTKYLQKRNHHVRNAGLVWDCAAKTYNHANQIIYKNSKKIKSTVTDF